DFHDFRTNQVLSKRARAAYSSVMRFPILLGTIALAASVGCQASAPTERADADEWLVVTEGGLSIRTVRADSSLVPMVRDAIRAGESIGIAFFSAAAPQSYAISIFPDRTTLTERLRSAWQFPTFQAECWLIAAAWAAELDLLSPNVWNRDACGHDPRNTTHIR